MFVLLDHLIIITCLKIDAYCYYLFLINLHDYVFNPSKTMRLNRLFLRPEFWIAVIVSIAGITHLLHQLNFSLSEFIKTYWPGLFIITGIIQLTSSRYRDVASTILLIAIGILLILKNVGYLSIEMLKSMGADSLRDILKSILQP